MVVSKKGVYCGIIKTNKMNNLKNRIKREIKEVEKELYIAIELNNHTYAQTLYFQDLLPLINKLKTL